MLHVDGVGNVIQAMLARDVAKAREKIIEARKWETN